jgi:GntR family transcriptional regulator/MocR family aminotransferase
MDSPIINQVLTGLSFDRSAERAVFLQLADALLSLIKSGALRSGQKLPSSRDLADLLKINRITASKAYEELEMQGWLESFVGKGTFVSTHLADHHPEILKETTSVSLKTAGFSFLSSNYPDGLLETPY